MIQFILKGLIRKHGLIGVLLVLGDLAVKVTKTKKDDKAWAKIKKVIKSIT